MKKAKTMPAPPAPSEESKMLHQVYLKVLETYLKTKDTQTKKLKSLHSTLGNLVKNEFESLQK
jgi:hypothetical protein